MSYTYGFIGREPDLECEILMRVCACQTHPMSKLKTQGEDETYYLPTHTYEYLLRMADLGSIANTTSTLLQTALLSLLQGEITQTRHHSIFRESFIFNSWTFSFGVYVSLLLQQHSISEGPIF